MHSKVIAVLLVIVAWMVCVETYTYTYNNQYNLQYLQHEMDQHYHQLQLMEEGQLLTMQNVPREKHVQKIEQYYRQLQPPQQPIQIPVTTVSMNTHTPTAIPLPVVTPTDIQKGKDENPETIYTTEFDDRTFNFFNFENITFPGTNWCGPGNTAKDFDDLGFFRDTDICCRTHDYCQRSIEPGNTKYGVTNSDRFTLMHCDCDKTFLLCLSAKNWGVGEIISRLYFNNEQRLPVCFDESPPKAGCLRSHVVTDFLGVHRRCEIYRFDKGDIKSRLFDLPLFIQYRHLNPRFAIDEEENNCL